MSRLATSKNTEQVVQFCKEQLTNSMSKRTDIIRAFDALKTKFPDKEGEIKEAMNFFSGMITAYDNVIMNITGETMILPPVSLN